MRQAGVVCSTAFSQYALEGFRVDALDYLLKHFDYLAFRRAALKAKAFGQRRPLLSLTSLRSMEESCPPLHGGAGAPAVGGARTVLLAGETPPVSDGYGETFDQFLSRWK